MPDIADGTMGRLPDGAIAPTEEQRGREVERHFRRMAEMSSDLVGFCDFDGTLRYVSPACRALLGVEPSALEGRSGWELIHPDDRSTTLERLTVAARSGEAPASIAFRALRSDGSPVWVEANVRPFHDDAGGVEEIWFVLRDISQRREAEEALRRSELRLKQVIDGLPEAIAVLRGGRLVFVNRAKVSYLGYERAEELVGRSLADLVHPEDRPGLAEPLQRRLREVRFVRREGEVVTAEVVMQELEFDGAPALLVSARDVSERKQMHARLLQTDRMVSVGTLAAGIAHEINNPLACVIANLDCVAEDLPALSADVRQWQDQALPQHEIPARTALATRLADLDDALRDARDGAERVRRIVKDLRTLSRGDDDRRAPIDVEALLESSVNMVWNEIRHRARLTKKFAEVPPVEANEARLGQVFINLLLNAAQAIPEGHADRNEIRLAIVCDGGRVIVTVGDTGAGIAPEIRARVFDPFFTTKPIGVGTGLGLSICQSIVASLGGEISFESEVGKGSQFRVSLLAAGERPLPVQGQTALLATTRRARILVVDDEPMIGTSVRRSLGNDHHVVAVTSAVEALEILESGQRFDLILCDLMMPVMTGMDFHSRLAALDPAQLERTVYVTGGAFTPRAREFLDQIENQKIDKPFDLQQLRALVRARLREP